MTVEKPKPKQLLRPITTGADGAMNQSQFLEITCNTLKTREKSRVRGAIGFGFASHWLKNWRESFKPITKRSNRNYIITFDSHLKTALMVIIIISNGNRTEWSTIQGVIGQVISNQLSAITPELYDTKHDYPRIVQHEVLLPINCVNNKMQETF